MFRLLFFLATVCACALTVWSVVAEPLPLRVSSLALLSYTGFVAFALTVRRDIFVDGWVDGPRGARGILLLLDDDRALRQAARERSLPALVLAPLGASAEDLTAMNTDGFGVAARVSRASGTGLGLFAPPAQIRAAVSAFLDRARGVPGLAVEAALPDFATPALGRELAKLGLVALLPRKSWISDDFARRPEGTGTAKSTLDDFARRPEGTGTAKSMLNDFARRPEGSGTAKSMLNDFTKGATPRALRRALRDGCILHLSTTRYSPASSAADAMDALVALAAEKQLPFVTLRSWTRETKD